MSEERALQPIEQKEVEFYGDDLTAVRAEDGHVYVVMAHMCDALGIDTQGQARRIRRHTILSNGLTWVDILSTQGEQTQRRRAQVLRVDLVPLWLSGIRANSVSEEIRPKLEKFQEAAAAVLWEAFQDGRLTVDPTFSELLERDSEAVEAYKMIAAMLKLARNQVVLESRLDAHHHQLTDHEQRLEEIEQQLAPGEPVTQSQAMQISQAVRTLAIAIGERSGGNEFGRVYGEMYRYFQITSCKLLPANRFGECMEWLNQWHTDVTGEPF